MISRRKFVVASLGTSVAMLVGCRNDTGSAPEPRGAGPSAKARLTLYFVGGTVFRRANQSLTAVQMSGKNEDGSYYVDKHHGRPMPHRSFLVLPAGTIPGIQPFDSGYKTKDLHREITPARDWQPVCLVGKDVQITHRGGDQFSYKCQYVAEFGHVSNGWTHKGNWHSGGPLGHPVNSRFSISGGTLTDGDAQNEKAKDRAFKIGNGPGKKLSDVAALTLDADTIEISGLGSDIKLAAGQQLKGFVLAGPENPEAQPGKPHIYRHINHAVLLHTLYEIPESAGDIRPVTDDDIHDVVKDKQPHPCDLGVAVVRDQRFVPPDTEYCVNYDELP